MLWLVAQSCMVLKFYNVQFGVEIIKFRRCKDSLLELESVVICHNSIVQYFNSSSSRGVTVLFYHIFAKILDVAESQLCS